MLESVKASYEWVKTKGVSLYAVSSLVGWFPEVLNQLFQLREWNGRGHVGERRETDRGGCWGLLGRCGSLGAEPFCRGATEEDGLGLSDVRTPTPPDGSLE